MSIRTHHTFLMLALLAGLILAADWSEAGVRIYHPGYYGGGYYYRRSRPMPAKGLSARSASRRGPERIAQMQEQLAVVKAQEQQDLGQMLQRSAAFGTMAAPPVAVAATPKDAPGSSREPMVLLATMCRQLASVGEFALDAVERRDEILPSGARTQLTSGRRYAVVRPKGMLMQVAGDGANLRAWYDGSQLTVLNTERNQYGRMAVKGSVDQMIEALYEQYGATLPLSDLLHSGLYTYLSESVHRSSYVGLHQVGGLACHHLSFVGDEADWQLWIQAEGPPLPRKVVIAYKNVPGVPRYEAQFIAWRSSIGANADTFVFQAPDGAQDVGMEKVLDPVQSGI